LFGCSKKYGDVNLGITGKGQRQTSLFPKSASFVPDRARVSEFVKSETLHYRTRLRRAQEAVNNVVRVKIDSDDLPRWVVGVGDSALLRLHDRSSRTHSFGLLFHMGTNGFQL
jgi:hypothetical protein